jgi:ABC-type amino acid transport substrate-binding protein
MLKRTGVLLVCGLMAGIVVAQPANPTLVPPTLVPATPVAIEDSLATVSRVGRIQDEGVVRVGIVLTEPPFGELTLRGEIAGMDADLARALADLWGVELELVSLRRQDAFNRLDSGDVDMLIAAQVHRRELDQQVEFSMTYHQGAQTMMVLADSPAESPLNLLNQPVGVTQATDAETALQAWMEERGVTFQVQRFPLMDRAYSALLNGRVAAIAGRYERLLRVSALQPDAVRLFSEALVTEPYAIVLPRQDIHLRNLVNRSLQILAANGDLEEMNRTHFPALPYNPDVVATWANTGDTIELATAGTDIPYPAQYTLPRLLAGQPLRIAGVPADEPVAEAERRLHAVSIALANELASRWQMPLEWVHSTPEEAVRLVETGQADLAIGVVPDWNASGQVDFTSPYLRIGDRLMIESRDGYMGFSDLRNRWVATLIGEPEAEERARAWAESINARVNFYRTSPQDAANTIQVSNNADVVYGNILNLLPHVQADPQNLELTERWYSREYRALATPLNDIDFRLLVEYTLQEMAADGTLLSILGPVLYRPEEMPEFDQWPGPSTYYGLELRRP